MYNALKHIHLAAVTLSLSLFALRGLWMLADSSKLHQPWVKIVPHIIDAILLASAVALVAIIHQYPFVDAWLTAKIVALAAYIGLGMLALRGRSKPLRAVGWILALLVFGYIVAVAIHHDPWPW